MIATIRGKLTAKNPPQIIVECGGIGYELDVPMSTFFNLGSVGEDVFLHTHLSIREDAHLLFGFLTVEEKDVFRQLIRISGVGPRMALAVLSGLSVPDLQSCIATSDASRLVKVPGIGKKTAERILLELTGKLSGLTNQAGTSVVINDSNADILNALLALGYSEREAKTAMSGLDPSLSVSDGIRAALKTLSKA